VTYVEDQVACRIAAARRLPTSEDWDAARIGAATDAATCEDQTPVGELLERVWEDSEGIAHPLLPGVPDIRDFLISLDDQVGSDRPDQVVRQALCLAGATRTTLGCDTCGTVAHAWEGSCSARACAICHERYQRRKRADVVQAFGEPSWLDEIVVTLPDTPWTWQGKQRSRNDYGPRDFTRWAKRIGHALEAFYTRRYDILPTYVIQIHHTGENDPTEAHPHFNVLLHSHGLRWDPERQEYVMVELPTWLPEDRWELRRRYLLRAVCLPRSRRGATPWNKRTARREHAIGCGCARCTTATAQMAHRIRYVIRAPGDGDPVARHVWTLPRARMLRPGGCIAGGGGGRAIRSAWMALRPPPRSQAWSDLLHHENPACECCLSPTSLLQVRTRTGRIIWTAPGAESRDGGWKIPAAPSPVECPTDFRSLREHWPDAARGVILGALQVAREKDKARDEYHQAHRDLPVRPGYSPWAGIGMEMTAGRDD